jgi:hypothetical protein
MSNKILYVVATFMVLLGFVWIGQGTGLIRGSVMTDESRWAIIGSILIVVALGLFWFAKRRKV